MPVPEWLPPWIFIWIGLNWSTIETQWCCSSETEIHPEFLTEYASARMASTLNFHLNWSELVNYRDPAMLFMRDRVPPWIGRLGWFIWICQCENNFHPELVWNGQLSRPVFCWYKYKVNHELVDKKIMKDRSPSWICPNIDDCADYDYHDAKDLEMHMTSTLDWSELTRIGLNWSELV